MKVLIDGDGCPVTRLAVSICKELKKEVTIVCDTSHIINDDYAKTIVVSTGSDSVDFALLNITQKEDIVITQDYGLASMVISKGAYCINQNGRLYTNENIDALLFSRHLSKKARNAGSRVKGPKKRSNEDNKNFEIEFRKLIDTVKK